MKECDWLKGLGKIKELKSTASAKKERDVLPLTSAWQFDVVIGRSLPLPPASRRSYKLCHSCSTCVTRSDIHVIYHTPIIYHVVVVAVVVVVVVFYLGTASTIAMSSCILI